MYKCTANLIRYKLIDEWMTSKICSKCACINDKLKASKTFKCINTNCNLLIDRDINSARCMFIKAFNN